MRIWLFTIIAMAVRRKEVEYGQCLTEPTLKCSEKVPVFMECLKPCFNVLGAPVPEEERDKCYTDNGCSEPSCIRQVLRDYVGQCLGLQRPDDAPTNGFGSIGKHTPALINVLCDNSWIKAFRVRNCNRRLVTTTVIPNKRCILQCFQPFGFVCSLEMRRDLCGCMRLFRREVIADSRNCTNVSENTATVLINDVTENICSSFTSGGGGVGSPFG